MLFRRQLRQAYFAAVGIVLANQFLEAFLCNPFDVAVEWVAEERFQELIRKDNAYRRKIGLPELPTE